MTSLDGIEEIRVSEWQYIGDLTISQCPNLTDISALKEIGICEYLYIDLTENITEEMIADVYYNNPNIVMVRVSEEISKGHTRVKYDLTDNLEEVERKIEELEEELDF